MSKIIASAATAYATAMGHASSCIVQPKLVMKILSVWFLDASIIPGAMWRWKYC